MNQFKETSPFDILIIIGIFTIFITLLDIIYDKGWLLVTIILFIAIIFIAIFLLLLKIQKRNVKVDIFKDFEKELKGGLFHFKCPTCGGIFAIKKSKSNNKKPLKLTCPDCGAFGVISSNPPYIEDIIPEHKSINADFICKNCREGITLWAEGKNLYEKIAVYSCPFCGSQESMKRA